MKDYSHYAVNEAVHKELSAAFVSAVKILDTQVAIKRLERLLDNAGLNGEVGNVMGQFVSILNTKTSADE